MIRGNIVTSQGFRIGLEDSGIYDAPSLRGLCSKTI